MDDKKVDIDLLNKQVGAKIMGVVLEEFGYADIIPWEPTANPEHLFEVERAVINLGLSISTRTDKHDTLCVVYMGKRVLGTYTAKEKGLAVCVAALRAVTALKGEPAHVPEL